MKKSIKAALLSGLVFPGIGQLTLKRYIRGFLLILLAAAAVFIIIRMATQTALVILERELQYGIVDYSRILEIAHLYSRGNTPHYYACFLVIAFCWVYGIVDALIYSDKKINRVKPPSPPD